MNVLFGPKGTIFMNYLSDLRRIVGNRPLLSIGSTVLVFNEKNELLLNLRADTNTWGIPGGALELIETIEQTAVRELFEETGLVLNDMELLHVFSGQDMYFKYPNGDELYSVVCLFLAKAFTGDLKIQDNESIELKYFGLNNLPGLESRASKIVEWDKNH